MDMHKYGKDEQDYFGMSKGLGRNKSKDDQQAYVTDWLEIWDYVGGATFRGFVAEHQGERSLFVFFDSGVLGSDLKPGYVSQVLCFGTHIANSPSGSWLCSNYAKSRTSIARAWWSALIDRLTQKPPKG